MLYKKELEQIPTEKMPDKYPGALCVGVAKVVDLKRSGKILVVDFYQRADKSHLHRFCTDGKNYCTKNTQAGDVWTEQNPRVWVGYYQSADSKEDRQLAADFLDAPIYGSTNLLGIVDSFINHHRWEQRDRAYDRRENLRKEHFSMYPAYPADLESYCKTHLFTPYVFISTLDKKGHRQGRCSCCGAEFEVPKDVRSGQPTTCQVCGKSAVYRGTWLKHLREDKAHICIANKVDGQKLLRWVEVRRRFFYPDFVGEYAFDDYAYNLHLNTPKGEKIYFYKWQLCGHYYGQYGWYRDIGALCYDAAPVYADNLREVFGERYCGMDLKQTVAKHGKEIPFAVLLDNLEKIPAMEYLLKLGMTNLAKSVKQIPGVMDCLRPSFTGLFGIDGQFAKIYREMDVTFAEHRVIKYYGKFIPRELLEMYRGLGVSDRDVDTVEQILAGGMSFSRLVHYFSKQKRLNPSRGIDHILTDYRDYIDMSNALGVDLSHKGVRFPKNCVEAHNLILPRFNQLKHEAEDNQFAEAVKLIYENLRITAFEKDGFCIILPQRRSDLTTEGQSLNHCVGGERYAKNHMAGTSLIFFVRKVQNREKPFFTMEVNMESCHINQLYGFGDCSAPDEVRKFAEAFVKKLAPAKVQRKAS